jgi:Zn-dependent M16 (insulinase) family peptidase
MPILEEGFTKKDIILSDDSVPKTDSAMADKPISVQTAPIAAIVDVIVHTAQDNESSSCDATLKQLVDRYFEPHVERGITEETIENALFNHELRGDSESISHVQVIEGEIFMDISKLTGWPWDRQRMQFLLARLQEYVDELKYKCKEQGIAHNICIKDFEFVVVP